MKVYLSGPMTGLPEHNFPAFREAAARLREEGHEVLDPSEKGVQEGWEWSDYLRVDLAALVTCEAIALLPGWSRSRGAKLELHVARELGFHTFWLRQHPTTPPALARYPEVTPSPGASSSSGGARRFRPQCPTGQGTPSGVAANVVSNAGAARRRPLHTKQHPLPRSPT